MKTRAKKGFTLIELVISMVIIGIIGSTVAIYNLQAFKSWMYVGRQSQLVASTNNALNRMLKEIKTIRFASSIDDWDKSRFSFKDPKDPSKVISFSQGEGKTNLYRGASVIAKDLKIAQDENGPAGLVFEYLDQDGQPAEDKRDIRTVVVRLSVQQDDRSFVTRSAARIRMY